MKSILATTAALLLACPSTWAQAPATPPAAPRPADPAAEDSRSKEEQLAAAKRELVVLQMRHEDRHPVILQHRSKIARLQKEANAEKARQPAPDPATQLVQARAELANLRERYTEQHPAVINQLKVVAALERAQAMNKSGAPAGNDSAARE